jgi:hypothetical protein
VLVRAVLSSFKGGAGLLGGALIGEAFDGGDGGKLIAPVTVAESNILSAGRCWSFCSFLLLRSLTLPFNYRW